MSETHGGLGRAERIDRSRARAWMVQVHYRWESTGAAGSLGEALAETVATRRISPRRLPYVRRVLAELDAHLADVDRVLQEALENWRLERLSTLDRAVLRVAAAEMLYLSDIPPKVSIQEAIRLSEQYGGPDSPRFVNGVLDALYKRFPGKGT
jgi:N utilization substance protein B